MIDRTKCSSENPGRWLRKDMLTRLSDAIIMVTIVSFVLGYLYPTAPTDIAPLQVLVGMWWFAAIIAYGTLLAEFVQLFAQLRKLLPQG